ncbi:hypothetical protein PUR57_15170 [Streptomyces sp. JV176]|uniref:hypothetical protein n=1 Tax=Streptomyces sp. JV176 TaxID=858630 RepID=UPI002E799FCA|nr:hypothetical protein [Streptomyces sp. JV176]MEE1799997.1 hypothetical protein [Streptomyces sp. JV176]
MRVRKISVLTLAAVAVGLSLTACDPSSDPQPGTSVSTTVSSDSTASSGSAGDSSRSKDSSADGTSSGTPKKSGVACTDQLDYAGDSRSNAEINTIGEDTGTCPAPEKADEPSGTEQAGPASGTPKKSDVKCTDQIDYAGDARSNAEINSIGEDTGTCPPVQHK